NERLKRFTPLARAAGEPQTFTIEQARASMEHEGKIGATLLQLKDRKQLQAMRNLLLPLDLKQSHEALLLAAASRHPLDAFIPHEPGLDTLDPNFDLDRVALSPLGVVHLFRQYFFELDSFLGVPVAHVWLSPGTSLE